MTRNEKDEFEDEKRKTQLHFDIILERRHEFCQMIGQNIDKLFRTKLAQLLDYEH